MVATAAFAQVPINGAPQVLAQAQPKGAAAMPRLGTPRLYLIWNDSGAMSQDMAARALSPDGAARKNQIIASDRKLGASLQARLDAVIEAPSGIYDNVTLGIRVISEGKTIVDQKFPVGFIDKPGRLIRAARKPPVCKLQEPALRRRADAGQRQAHDEGRSDLRRLIAHAAARTPGAK